MFNFLIYAGESTLSGTLNTFNDNTHGHNLESLIYEELLNMAQNQSIITKCSKIEIHDISKEKEKYTDTHPEDRHYYRY